MYSTLLAIHSWARWLVIIFGVLAIFRSLNGWRNNQSFIKTDNIAGAGYVGSIHLQLLLGLLLYFAYSPITTTALENFGMAMKVKAIRYWSVEHITGMIIAAVIAQVGRIKSKKAGTDTDKHKKAFIYFSVSILIILIIVLQANRPWFRF